MSDLSVSMFGKLQIRLAGSPPACSLSQKARELLVYLLLHRRAQPREKLATLLWEHRTTKRAKAYLRKALWQLRQSIEPDDADVAPTLQADGDWVQIHPEADIWVDVAVFEDAFEEVRDCEMSEMTAAQEEALEEAASLYTGDLLENWYQDWCLRERERLKDMLLRILDRLTRCCEHRGAYDSGIQYGLRALRIDPARERIHRHLMRLRARAGDRSGALRQYERCTEVLDRELDVAPTTATRRLHQRIQDDSSPASPPREATALPQAPVFRQEEGGDGRGTQEIIVPREASREADGVSLRDGLDRLRQLQCRLAAVQKQLRREIEAVEVFFGQQG